MRQADQIAHQRVGRVGSHRRVGQERDHRERHGHEAHDALGAEQTEPELKEESERRDEEHRVEDGEPLGGDRVREAQVLDELERAVEEPEAAEETQMSRERQ